MRNINIMLFIPCIYLQSMFLKTNKLQYLNHSKIDHKAHFTSGANCHMFRHQGATVREFLSN